MFKGTDIRQGGLSTRFDALLSNLWISGTVALIGISAPIALSFVLLQLIDATPIQAFAAGAALCSTSLGTTFTILSTSGLDKSRLGVVLSSAAMIDDVFGLVLTRIISSLGASSDNFSAVTVVRPVFVSVAFAAVVPLLCRFVVQPLTVQFLSKQATDTSWRRHLARHSVAVVVHTLVLLGLVTGSSYAGTSNLFAAYIAGAGISWWDALAGKTLEQRSEKRPHKPGKVSVSDSVQSCQNQPIGVSSSLDSQHGSTPLHLEPAPSNELSGYAIYDRFYSPAVKHILKPFFFASIGFSIPITQMFHGAIFWRGIVYTILMLVGKLICGLVLVRFANLPGFRSITKKPRKSVGKKNGKGQVEQRTTSSDTTGMPAGEAVSTTSANTSKKRQSSRIPKPQSLYPAAMLGSAMVARGEIGFLISSLAESTGVFGAGNASTGGSSEIFLVVTWAILLCTIIGPVSVGVMAKRVKRLQAEERSRKTGKLARSEFGC